MSALSALMDSEMGLRGDRLAETFHEVQEDLVNTLYYLLGSHHDAQDAVQETFLKCWRARDQVEGVQNLRAWIFRIGLNAARDFQRSTWNRRARSLAPTTDQECRSEPSPADAAISRETLQRLHDALLGLLPKEKEIFLLRQNGDLTYEEIAELTGRPLGTVKTQMRAALAKLRRALRERG